jgi:CHAT domain-containing protein/Tfp pilus assembly protein PilF
MSRFAETLRVMACGGELGHAPGRLAKLLTLISLARLIAGVSLFASSVLDPTDLTTGVALGKELAGGQSHDYRFRLRAGEYVRVLVQQHTVDVAVSCLDPAGNEVLSIDSYPVGDPETIELVGGVSGEYRLRVNASETGASTGRYTLVVEQMAASTERHGTRAAAVRSFAEGMSARGAGNREGYLKAIGHVERALGHWRSAGDPREETVALSTMGLLYIEVGDRQRALQYTGDGLASAEVLNDRKLIGRALEAVGRVYNSFGEKRKAIEYCERALPFVRAVEDQVGEANVLDNLAVAYSGAGEKRKALAYFDRSARIFRELQDRRMLAELAGNIGLAYDNLGEYRLALDNHESELAFAREQNDRATQAVTLNNIGSAYAGLGEYQKALDAYHAALDLNRLLENEWNVSINLNNIGWVYSQLGNTKRALDYYQRSLELVRKVKDDRRAAATLNNIAALYQELGEPQKAIQTHMEALPLRRTSGDADGEANTLHGLGRAYARSGAQMTAREYFALSLAIHRTLGNRHMLARALRSAADLDREAGELGRARTTLEEALEISHAIRDKKGIADSLTGLAHVERDGGDLERAHQRAEEALAALEALRLTVVSPSLRASLVSSARNLRELEIDVLMRLHTRQPDGGFAAAALVANEQGRARSLLELLGESHDEIRRGVDPALLARERELQSQISAKAELQTRLLSRKQTDGETAVLEKELRELAVELEQSQSRIRAASPQYAALMHPAPLDLREIQTKVLDDDTVLLEFALGDERSYLWAVTPASIDVFELPSRVEVTSAARRVYDLLTERNRRIDGESAAARATRLRHADEAYLAAARNASRMLLGPAAALLVNKRLLIVADGILQYLPFGALPAPGADRPLIVDHEIVTSPSASVVAVLRQETANRQPTPKTLAVFADPVFSAEDPRVIPVGSIADRSVPGSGGRDWMRLRFSRTEAGEIARLAGVDSTFAALDFDASRETAMRPELADYRIVHFATHSLLNNDNPELSGVVLSLVDASGRPRNGYLRLYDIYNLRLNADLVVLSACSTALGEEVQGEGLIGLTRGFLYAGAARVAGTLWEVDDRTTAEVMKRFYQGMLARGERPAAALRAAQIALWKSKGWEAPYYWAAFALEGEWR